MATICGFSLMRVAFQACCRPACPRVDPEDLARAPVYCLSPKAFRSNTMFCQPVINCLSPILDNRTRQPYGNISAAYGIFHAVTSTFKKQKATGEISFNVSETGISQIFMVFDM